jgi:RNA polymerase sigma-70 factor, ECF subfamily
MSSVNDRTFDALVRQHSPSLTTFARSLVRDRWEAEEAVQATFVRAWKYVDSFDERGSFEGWLIRICRNVIIDHAVAANRRPMVVDPADSKLHSLEVSADASQDIVELLHQLSAAHAEVLVIVGVLGYSYEEAADMIGIPVGTVRSRLLRARTALADLLAEAASADTNPLHDTVA